MNFKNLTTLTALLSLINSSFYLLAPSFSLMILGRTATPIGLMNTRVAGACALGMCTISWLSHNLRETSFQKIVICGNLIMLGTLAIIEIQATLSGAINWVGWLFVITDSFLAVGYGYLLRKTVG